MFLQDRRERSAHPSDAPASHPASLAHQEVLSLARQTGGEDVHLVLDGVAQLQQGQVVLEGDRVKLKTRVYYSEQQRERERASIPLGWTISRFSFDFCSGYFSL